MKNARAFLSLTMFLFMSIAAFAHPGHGHHQDDPQGLMHYLTSPVHMISLIAVVGLALYVAYRKNMLPFKPNRRISK